MDDQTNPSQQSVEALFEVGDYAAVAGRGDPDRWQTFAAMGLIGLTEPALAGLERFEHSEARYFAAVALWIGGDTKRACQQLRALEGERPRRLLAFLQRKPLRILAQLPWVRQAPHDILSSLDDDLFQVTNISYHPDDLPARPNASIWDYTSRENPPDFYISEMIEWHLLPPDLHELACPVFGQTSDFDLHIQTVYPWLQQFDALITCDPSEWQEVSDLRVAPVVSFPKTFGIDSSLGPINTGARPIDMFVSGSLLLPYHPDKAQVFHQLLKRADLNIVGLEGWMKEQEYLRTLSSSKSTFCFIRHPGAMPTRGLEALAQGCVVAVQAESSLRLYYS